MWLEAAPESSKIVIVIPCILVIIMGYTLLTKRWFVMLKLLANAILAFSSIVIADMERSEFGVGCHPVVFFELPS